MILCDTGPLVAAFNAADRDHVRCTAFLRENWSRLVVPYLAVTEVCHLLADRQRRGRPPPAGGGCGAVAGGELRGALGHSPPFPPGGGEALPPPPPPPFLLVAAHRWPVPG